MLIHDLNAENILKPRYNKLGLIIYQKNIIQELEQFIFLNNLPLYPIKSIWIYVWIQFFRFENKDKDAEMIRREELLYKYFDMLDDDDIISLYNIYQNDFKMFGYSFEFRGLKLNV